MTLPNAATARGRDILGKAELPKAALPAFLVFVALVGMAFENGGFSPGAWTTASVGLLWVTALVLLLATSVELKSLERLWLALLGGLLAWTALSISWSFSHAHSLLDLRRDLVYLAGVAVVLLLASRRSAGYLLAAVWAAALVVVAYALVRYLFEPGLRSGGAQPNLLFRPLGYANAMGIFTGFTAILSIAFAVRAPRRAQRTLACASIAPLTAALYLTSSRASALAVGVGLAAMLAVDRDRRQLIGALLVLAPVGAAIATASAHSRLADQSTVDAAGARQAHVLALWIGLGAVVLALTRPTVETAGAWLGRLPRRRGLPGAIAVAAIAGATYVAIRGGSEFFTGGYRPSYWHVAWREYVAHPWLGSGAGTFGDYWQRYGNQTFLGGALDAHNLYLETLAELGPIGLALLISVLAVPLVAAFNVRWHPFASAATGAYVAFLSHAALDWDWEMPVVTLAGLVCAAAVIVANRDSLGPRLLLSGRARAGVLVLTVGLALFALIAQFTSGLGGTGP